MITTVSQSSGPNSENQQELIKKSSDQPKPATRRGCFYQQEFTIQKYICQHPLIVLPCIKMSLKLLLVQMATVATWLCCLNLHKCVVSSHSIYKLEHVAESILTIYEFSVKSVWWSCPNRLHESLSQTKSEHYGRIRHFHCIQEAVWCYLLWFSWRKWSTNPLTF